MSSLVTSDLIQDILENPEVIDITLYSNWVPERVREVTYHIGIFFISGDTVVLEAKDFGALIIKAHTFVEKFTKRPAVKWKN